MKYIFGLVLWILSFQCAYGWVYSEHVKITEEAHNNACLLLKADGSLTVAQKELLQVFCAPSVALCHGHMVALAGDHARRPESFIDVQHEEYLFREKLDCTNILKPNLVPPERPEREGLRNAPLLQSRLAQVFRSIDLVTNNSDHFQPFAPAAWEKHFKALQKIVPEPSTYQTIFASHAFALHFLEDSFSAGHNGLEDRDKLRQDLDNAYHDDINHTGIFLANSEEEWFTYGDNELASETYFVRFRMLSETAIAAAIRDVGKRGKKQPEIHSDTFYRDVKAALEESPAQRRLVLSVPLKVGTFFLLSPCYHTDSCDKQEVVVLSLGESDPDCPRVATESSYEIFACSDTKKMVVDQATRSVTALLMHLVGVEESKVNAKKAEVGNHFPRKYFALGPPAVGSGSINKSPLLLAYGRESYSYCPKDSCRCDKHPEPQFRDWGFSIDNESSSLSELDGAALSWTMHSPFSDYSSGRLALRFEIANDEGHVLDAVDMSVFSPSIRTPRNLFGVYLLGSLGLDNVWQGSDEFNEYAGIGVGIDAHLGKRIVYFEATQLRHWRTSDGTQDGFRLEFGLRGASIDLAAGP